MLTRLCVSTIALLALSLTNTAHSKNTAQQGVINDSWYTMRSGNTPFGFYREVIEHRDGKYSYRYALTKFENNSVYQENIGALAQEDLTPIAFNLNKSGVGATETTNASYSPSPQGGSFAIEVTGAKATSFKRAAPKNIILDVFFPLWLKRQWSKLKPGYRGWVNTFAEDPQHADFRARMVRFEVKGQNTASDCLDIHVEMDDVKGEWCMRPDGTLVTLKVGGFLVQRAKSEEEARSILAKVLPKTRSAK